MRDPLTRRIETLERTAASDQLLFEVTIRAAPAGYKARWWSRRSQMSKELLQDER